jgi:hypothetical protein
VSQRTFGKAWLRTGFPGPLAWETAVCRELLASSPEAPGFGHLKRFAQKLEAGKFDAVFMADHLAVLNMPVEAHKRSHMVTSFEPFALLSALAAVTEHIGLVATASTTFGEAGSSSIPRRCMYSPTGANTSRCAVADSVSLPAPIEVDASSKPASTCIFVWPMPRSVMRSAGVSPVIDGRGRQRNHEPATEIQL